MFSDVAARKLTARYLLFTELLGICFLLGVLLLGICFLLGVLEDVVVEIGEGEKGGCGGKRGWNERRVTGEQWSGKSKMRK